jgi:hypothetical protein
MITQKFSLHHDRLSLNAIFNEGEYADKVVARALKKHAQVGEF